MLRSWCAIGLGLVLIPTNFANAEQQEIRRHFTKTIHHRHDAVRHRLADKDGKALALLKKQLNDLRKDIVAVEALRRELNDLKQTIWGMTPLSITLSSLPRPQSAAVVEPKQITLKLPDLGPLFRPAPQVPVAPATASLPAVIEERAADTLAPKSAVEEAKTYLINTATPGYTMVRQGVPVAIGRMHPDFVVKLAEAVKLARATGMTHAGVFSAYRPPAFGIGGFSDKFNSLHSYGLAADMTGIGAPGSRLARIWQSIVRTVGLFLPYGPDNRAEFNHTQLVPTKVAAAYLRRTITGNEPKDLRQMWLASGVSAYVEEATGARPTLAASAASPVKTTALPAGSAPDQIPEPQSPERRSAPKASRAGRSGKRRSGSAHRSASKRTASAGRKTAPSRRTTRKSARKKAGKG